MYKIVSFLYESVIPKKIAFFKFNGHLQITTAKFYYKFDNHKLPPYFQSFSLERGSRLNHYFSIYDIPLPRMNHDFATGTLRNCIPYTINHTLVNIKSKVFTHTQLRDFAVKKTTRTSEGLNLFNQYSCIH